MNRAILIWFFSLSFSLSVHAQNTFSFRAQVIHSHLGPQKKVRVLINNQIAAITDEEGIFQVVLPRRTMGIKVTLTQGDFQVLYPFGGYVAIPRNLDDIPQVVIGSAQDNAYLQQYIRLYRLRKNSMPSQRTVIQQRMDSVRNLLQIFRYTDNDLKKVERIQDGRDEFYPLISADVTGYLRKTFSLLTTFRLLHAYALENTSAMQQLIQAGNEYNESYLKLYREQLNYQRALSAYWQNDSLTAAYSDLANFSLNKFHSEKIFSIQTVILQMKQYSTGKKKKARDKKIVEQQIEKELKDLDLYYPILEVKTFQVMRWLGE
jgi:hypothetical protein